MGKLTTQAMSRLTAAGLLSKVDDAVKVLADLNALHILDYTGDEDGFSLGSPTAESEEIGRDLNRYRSASSQISVSTPRIPLEAEPVRGKLQGDLPDLVVEMVRCADRISAIDSELSNIDAESAALELLRPLGLDLDLLSGYESLTVFVGTTKAPQAIKAAARGGIVFTAGAKPTVVAAFCENDSAPAVQSSLEDAGFVPLAVPEGEGEISARLADLAASRARLAVEERKLQRELDGWSAEHGGTLLASIELLERDMSLALGPIRVAVSAHAFVLDGWVETSRSEEIREALADTCIDIDIQPFKITPGGGGHAHHGPEQQFPPIKFVDRHTSKPLELLTDLMGRPAYGKVDPTLFMLFTYPLFFGLILGDMVYGVMTIMLAWFLFKRIGHFETGMLASKFILYIGISTVVFGYIYGEFAGFEILPHGTCDIAGIVSAHACTEAGGMWGWTSSHAPAWATWVTGAYPNAGQFHWSTEELSLFAFVGIEHGLPFSMELAYPFHRVVPVDSGGNLEHLILLTIYMGVVHVLLGLVIGFRDIWLHGDVHGNAGPIVALFDRGSWIVILIGGFMFAYGFLGLGTGHTDEGYVAFLTSMRNIGGAMAGVGMLMLIYASWAYHGMPVLIAAFLGPIEAIGMMPTVISYVRLFAVGMAGVKIAETGNNMLYGHIEDGHGVGLLGAVADLGHQHVEGLVLLLAVAPVLLAIGIKLFRKRLPAAAGRFGLLHGMTFSGVFGMVLLDVDVVTVLTVLSPFAIVPGLAFVLAYLDRADLSIDAQISLAMLSSWFVGLIVVGGVYMVVTLARAWLGVQFFAWGLGVASPNIHTARLHLVEWMKQFYQAVGEAFKPFGFTAAAVEVE